MSIKLRILSIWLPEFIIIRELKRTSNLTNDGLDQLLKKCCHDPLDALEDELHLPVKRSLDERRTMMAAGHNLRVKVLVECLGYEKAIENGREKMFKAGLKMGIEARKRLGVGENIQDAIKASKILYSILGIYFRVEYNRDYMVLKVKRCALAVHYSPEACQIMSAADEGVLKGLNENMDLKFVERITEGADVCTACITLKQTKPNFGTKKEVKV